MSMVFLCLRFFLALQLANGNAFLKANPEAYSERMSEVDVQTSLLAEVEGGLGTSVGSRLEDMKSLLLPIFTALPKNEHGGLGHATVRYALHRVFVQRHGWFIQGLDRAGESWSDASHAGILKDHVPAYVQDLLEKRLMGKGFGLHELAVLAATVEHLVHSEALAKLGTAFKLHQQSLTSQLNKTDAYEILETYIMGFILGDIATNKSFKTIMAVKAKMHQIYLPWPETRTFVSDVLGNVTGDAQMLDFAMVARVAERLGERFGSFQDKECSQLKAALLKSEDRGTGRLRLADFYKPAAGRESGSWQFQESVPYLKGVGALDESSPEDPKVIVSNYLGSQANCIATSSFYAVCCMDECESLLGHLEKEIRTSEANSSHIATLVAGLPSATVAAPRELSGTLRRRLDEIAETHGGMVPLHGRLFAQWMHNAYPRECPFPHMSGTTAPLGSLDWADKNAQSATATMEDMQRIIEQSRKASAVSQDEDAEEELIPWSPEEELLVVRALPEMGSTPASAMESIRRLVGFAAAASVAFGLVRNLQSSCSPKLAEDSSHKFYV